MKVLLLTFFITFICITAVALFINSCRRKLRKTSHGLTGMCHNNGGSMCSGCVEKMKSNKSANIP